MSKTLKYQLILHLIVLVWGLTGILGDLISISALKIVFFRTAIAVGSLFIIGFFIKSKKILSVKQTLSILTIGMIVGLHWITFFYAIKISTVSIGVVCMSLTTLFVSFLEPLFFKRKISPSEIVISVFILLGIIIIFGFEFKYVTGILCGVASAFFAALFSVFNGKFIRTISPFTITKFEMIGALIMVSIILILNEEMNLAIFKVSTSDFVLVLILGLICTTVAFLISVWVMKLLSPFTVSMSVNMEPIYTIILAVILFPEQEKMTLGFYVGGSIIIGSIFINALIKKRNRKNISINA